MAESGFRGGNVGGGEESGGGMGKREGSGQRGERGRSWIRGVRWDGKDRRVTGGAGVRVREGAKGS